MKLEISNSNGIVKDAFTEVSEFSFSIIINTTKRWLRPDSVMTDGERRVWYYHPEDSDAPPDSVGLFADNDAEKEILDRLPFELQNKEQLWILLPANNVLEPSEVSDLRKNYLRVFRIPIINRRE